VAVDRHRLPEDTDQLKDLVVSLSVKVDHLEEMLRQVLEAKTGRKSEQLSKDRWLCLLNPQRSGASHSDRRGLQEVRLGVHNSHGDEAFAADRKVAGEPVVIGVSDCGEVRRSFAVARQQKMFERMGIVVNEQTMGDWLQRVAELLSGLHGELKRYVLESKVIDTLSRRSESSRRRLPIAPRDRSRAGPSKFLKDYRGYVQAIAYAAYDHLFQEQQRGLTEVACWAHARRHVYQAMESDSRLQQVLWRIAKLYKNREAVQNREAGAGMRPHRRSIAGFAQSGNATAVNSFESMFTGLARKSVAEECSGESDSLRDEELAGVDALRRRW
jgi:hypothetical protein